MCTLLNAEGFLFCIYCQSGIQMPYEQCLSLFLFSAHQLPSLLNGKKTNAVASTLKKYCHSSPLDIYMRHGVETTHCGCGTSVALTEPCLGRAGAQGLLHPEQERPQCLRHALTVSLVLNGCDGGGRQ